MDSLFQDVRYSLRRLLKTPGFTAVAVLTLGLGIGASIAMFTVVDSVLLRPLAYADPERLVMVWERPPYDPEADNNVSPANLFAWREQARSFQALAAMADRTRNLTGGGEPEEVPARLSSANYFDVLGVRAAYGRTYTTADEGENVVVLSHRFWQRRYGGDPGIVGRTLIANGEALTVLGVMPSDYSPVGVESPDVWLPIQLPPELRGRFLRVVGRLQPGVTLEQARSEMRTVADRLAAEFPAFNTEWSADVVPLHEQEVGDVRPALLVLFGGVGLLLLIACANLANLLLGRAAATRKEMAVRLSLGGTRWRLVRQTMTEALVLAVVAGAVGLLLATWGLELLVRLVPSSIALPRLAEIGLDPRIVGFATGVALLTGALFGAVPALAGSAMEPGGALRDATRGSTRRHNRLRRALVTAEVAVTVVLLAGAGLLARSLHNLLVTDTGMRTEHVLTMRVSRTGADHEDDATRAFLDELLPRLEALPGARAVGAIGALPLRWKMATSGYTVVGRPTPTPDKRPNADIRIIAGDYHRAMGIPLLRGRTFDGRDHEEAPRVFVVNEALAAEQFPGEDPIGRRLSIRWGEMLEGEIIGVVGSVRESGLDEDPAPAMYWAFRQQPFPFINLVIRTAGEPAALAGGAVAAVHDIDPNQPVAELQTMGQVVRSTVARPRFNLILLGGFAAASLLLAGLGLFGVVSYSVAQRRQEIGVRVTLGAKAGDVLRLVVSEGMFMTVLGLALGLAAAVAVTRVMASLLYGVSPTDPLTLAGVSVFLGAVALLASYLPARRAARLDPVIALRKE